MPTGRSARHFVFFRLKMEDHGRMLLLIPLLRVAGPMALAQAAQ